MIYKLNYKLIGRRCKCLFKDKEYKEQTDNKPVGMKRQYSLMKPKFILAVYTRKRIKRKGNL